MTWTPPERPEAVRAVLAGQVALLAEEAGRPLERDGLVAEAFAPANLELSEVNIEGTIKTQGGGDGADDLCDDAVQVGVCGTGQIQIASAYVINCLIVNHE